MIYTFQTQTKARVEAQGEFTHNMDNHSLIPLDFFQGPTRLSC